MVITYEYSVSDIEAMTDCDKLVRIWASDFNIPATSHLKLQLRG